MAEMSLERIAELLSEWQYLGYPRWDVEREPEATEFDVFDFVGTSPGGDQTRIDRFTAEAVAREVYRITHLAAPPAERAGGSEAAPAATRGRLPDAVAAIRGLVEGAGDDDLVGLYSHATPRNICLHAGTLRALADAAGRLEAGQLSGNSGQLGEVVDRLGKLVAKCPDNTIVRASIGNAVVLVTASDLRALLAAAERGRPASDLRSQVLALAELKPCWYDGEGEAYDPKQLADVADVLDRLGTLAKANVYPMAYGRVRVEWGDGPIDDSLEIDPQTLAMRMHLYDLDSGETIVGEIAPESLLAAAGRGAGAEKAYMALNNEIEQTLGKALGYPKLYPDASKVDDGAVGVGDHTAASLADEAAERIAKLQASLAERGAGAEAGPAVRELMDGVVAFKALGMSPDITTAFLAVIPIDRLSAALRELNMEPPR